VAWKERNGLDVVHDGRLPHGSIDGPVVRALVLLRPPGKARDDNGAGTGWVEDTHARPDMGRG
jgi:hypothetical protein